MILINAVTNPLNGHLYYIYRMKMISPEAQSYCESQGDYLATRTNQEEQDFVFGLAASSEMMHVTTGGTDEGHEGVWTWMNGEALTYSNWDYGEPNNGLGQGQNYLLYYGNGL